MSDMGGCVELAAGAPLWNWYGTRRHISDGRCVGTVAWTLCGQAHQSREKSERRHPTAKLDNAPLCQKCAKKAGMGVEPSAVRMVEEARQWFAVAAPKINGIIGFASVHGFNYDGPEAPKWMQKYLDGAARSGRQP